MGAPAPFLAEAPASFPVPDLAPVPDPCPKLVLSRPPRLPWLARFFWRETTRFAFTIASSVVSLATVAVSSAMAVQSLSAAVAKFVNGV